MSYLTTMEIERIENEITGLENNAMQRQYWLNTNMDSPRFEEIRGDLGDITLKIQSRKDRIKNLSSTKSKKKKEQYASLVSIPKFTGKWM